MSPEQIARHNAWKRKVKELESAVSQLALDKQILLDVLRRTKLSAAERRELVAEYSHRFGISERRCCELMRIARSVQRYSSPGEKQAESAHSAWT